MVNQRAMDARSVTIAFAATAGLDSVGEWQVRVTLFKGAQQTQVKFTLRVMPNI